MYSMPSHVSLNLGKNVLVHDRLKLSSDWLFLSVFVANWGITNTVDLVHVDNSQSNTRPIGEIRNDIYGLFQICDIWSQ